MLLYWAIAGGPGLHPPLFDQSLRQWLSIQLKTFVYELRYHVFSRLPTYLRSFLFLFRLFTECLSCTMSIIDLNKIRYYRIGVKKGAYNLNERRDMNFIGRHKDSCKAVIAAPQNNLFTATLGHIPIESTPSRNTAHTHTHTHTNEST